MKLFQFFMSKAPNRVFLSIVLGGFAGITYALLIPVVLSALTPEDPDFPYLYPDVSSFMGIQVSHTSVAILFLAACLLIMACRTVSRVILVRTAMEITSDIRRRIYQRVSFAPVAALEKTGPAKLVAAITTDVGRIVIGARIMPDILVSLVTVIGMLGFMLYLNENVFWFVLTTIFIGIVTFQIPMMIGNFFFARSRVNYDNLNEAIRGLLYGAKELKLSQQKRRHYYRDILNNYETRVLEDDKTGQTIVSAATSYGDLISFFVIGIIAFIFRNYQPISTEELVGVVMALLYISGPISVIIYGLPQIMLARVSLNKVNKLFSELPLESEFDYSQSEQQSATNLLMDDSCEVADNIQEDDVMPITWDQIRYRGVTYQYNQLNGSDSAASNEAQPDHNFQLGPIDLTLKKGEITFIIGGNGSGKSTLSKLVTLHYLPTGGEIWFGDTQFTASNASSFRESISAIYTDFHLFDRILKDVDKATAIMITHYLESLGLSNKVTMDGNKFSTTDLSDGQRKRLALLVAFLEDRDLYLFDEWAADQDPDFKRVFYHDILPALKARGKAIAVISHDENYFDVADRVVVLEEGKVKREDVRAEHPAVDMDTVH